MDTQLLVSASRSTPFPINVKPLAATFGNAAEEGGEVNSQRRESDLEWLISKSAKIQDLQQQLAQRKPIPIDEDELHEMFHEVERERQALNRERQQLEKERRQFLEEKQEIRLMLGQMEGEIARERAEHHRQQAEMKWREESLRIARKNLDSEKMLVVAGLRFHPRRSPA